MTVLEAKKLCILKWQWIVDNINSRNKHLIFTYLNCAPELRAIHTLRHNCAYCELYADNMCRNCPLYLNDNRNCADDRHPYVKFCDKRTKSSAKVLLDLIINTKVEGEL